MLTCKLRGDRAAIKAREFDILLAAIGAAEDELDGSLPAENQTLATGAANQIQLRILQTTDLHVCVLAYDYYADCPSDTMGLSRAAGLIQRLRAGAANSLLADCGDFLQGNPMGDFIARERGLEDGDIHPVIAAMNAVGYDAATLGNHEFDYGLAFLRRALADAGFPVVSANVALELGPTPDADRTLLPPFVILDRELTDGAGARHPIRIGLIGFLPPLTLSWHRRRVADHLDTRDIVETARAWVPRMKAEGADIVIALSHSGIGADRSDWQENASLPLARVDGIDVVLAGHSHLVFPGPRFRGLKDVDAERGTLAGKPAVMAGFWGQCVGVVDLMLARGAQGWQVVDHAARIHPVAERDADGKPRALVGDLPGVAAAVQDAHGATLNYIRRPVGHSDSPLHSYFAAIGEDSATRIVAEAKRWHVRRALSGGPFGELPLIVANAPYKAGGRGGPEYFCDVPAGELMLRHLADLYLFPNEIRAVSVTGAVLANWLERSAAYFNRIQPGQEDQFLVNPGGAAYNFDALYGLSYGIDLSRAPRFTPWGYPVDGQKGRIVDLLYQGRPVGPEARFVVATNSYRAAGGGAFPGALGDSVVYEAPDRILDILAEFVAEGRGLGHPGPAPWRFCPMPGTSVLFDSGPGALAHLDEVSARGVEHVGKAPGGFHRFRLPL